jgi:hypothetical protein
MSGDGVSLPTTLAQIGQVAKTQARSQQASVPTAGQLPDQDKEQLQPIRKVQEAQAKGKKTIKRRQEGSPRQDSRGRADDEDDADQAEAARRRGDEADGRRDHDPDEEPAAGPIPDLGVHIDIKA